MDNLLCCMEGIHCILGVVQVCVVSCVLLEEVRSNFLIVSSIRFRSRNKILDTLSQH